MHESVTFGLVRPPTDQPMDVVQGRKLLRDLLALLPPNWWFPLIQQDSQHGIATVFKRSRGEIDALLVNAGLAKVTSKGLRFKSGHPWESFKLSEGADFHYGSTRREQFVASVQPPGEPHKYKNKICAIRIQLPDNLLAALRQSTTHYNDTVAETNRKAAAGQRANEEEEAARLARKAIELSRTTRYPFLSKVFGPGDSISLDNENVAMVIQQLLSEIANLHKSAGRDVMALKDENGRLVKLIPGFSSSSHKKFLENARRANLVDSLASAFGGGRTSKDDVVGSLEILLKNYRIKKVRAVSVSSILKLLRLTYSPPYAKILVKTGF